MTADCPLLNMLEIATVSRLTKDSRQNAAEDGRLNGTENSILNGTEDSRLKCSSYKKHSQTSEQFSVEDRIFFLIFCR